MMHFFTQTGAQVKPMAAKRSRLKGLNGTSQERFAGVVARRADRVGCPIGVASERTSTRVKRSAWACGPPGARSGVLGRSPNADALSRSRRSLARHVAASVRDASVSASLTRSYPPTRRNSEAASAPTQLSRAALAWAHRAHAALWACAARALRAHGCARRSTTRLRPRGRRAAPAA